MKKFILPMVLSCTLAHAQKARQPKKAFVYVQTHENDAERLQTARAKAKADGEYFLVVNQKSVKKNKIDPNQEDALEQAVKLELESLKGKYAISTLFIAGHSDGEEIGDAKKGMIKYDSLKEYFSEKSCDQIPQSLILWGCNTNQPRHMQHWFEEESIKECIGFIAGFASSAPDGTRDVSKSAFDEILKNKNAIVASKDNNNELLRIIKSLELFNNNVQLSITANTCNEANYFFNDNGIQQFDSESCEKFEEADREAEHNSKELWQFAEDVRKIKDATYKGKVIDLSDTSLNNPLRKFYNILQRYGSCMYPEEGMFQGIKDYVATSLFQANIRKNLFHRYLPSKLSKTDYDKLIANLANPGPEVKKFDNKEDLGKMSSFIKTLRDGPKEKIDKIPYSDLCNDRGMRMLFDLYRPALKKDLPSQSDKVWEISDALTNLCTAMPNWLDWEQANVPLSRLFLNRSEK